MMVAAGCGNGQANTNGTRSTATSTSTATPQQRPSSSPTCSTAQVIRAWPLTRLAAEVVAVPVLDFGLTAVTAEVRAGIGGVLFLGNSPAPTDLRTRVDALVADAPAGTRPLVMADEEGGGVQRLVPAVSTIPWPRDMTRTMTPQAVRGLAGRLGRQMSALGVNVDLAPVADVDGRPGPSLTNPDGARSFSGSPGLAATYSVAFMDGLRDGGVLPVVKHFPGLGGTSANTDVGPAATRPLSVLGTSGLIPFRAAVAAGAPAVMVGNASVPGLSTLPASLSAAVTTGLLGQQLGFHGLVVTDSLSAGAVLTGGRSLAQAAVSALAAGADLILFGSTLTARDTALLSAANVRRTFAGIASAITTAVRTGTLPMARLTAAALAVADAAQAHLCP